MCLWDKSTSSMRLKVMLPWGLTPLTSKHTYTYTHPAPSTYSTLLNAWHRSPPPNPFLYLTHFPACSVDTGEQPCHPLCQAPSLFPLGWKTLVEWEKEGSGRAEAVEDELKGGGKYQGEWVCPLTPPEVNPRRARGLALALSVSVCLCVFTCVLLERWSWS